MDEMIISQQTRSVWKDYASKTFLLYRSAYDTHPLELKPGLFISFNGREGGVKIVNVLGYEDGPRGFTYLPWRESESRWATPVITLRGDQRFIIVYPTGFPHYGQHIQLHTIKIIDMPQNCTKS